MGLRRTQTTVAETPRMVLPDGRPAVIEYGPPPAAESAPPPYKPANRAQLDAWYDALRRANRKAEKASESWEKRKAWFSRYLAANNYSEADTRKRMATDWQLNDAMDAWSFWERETKRLQGMINAEAQMRAIYPLR